MIAPFSRTGLKDPSIGILYDFEAASDVLFVCFSGMGKNGQAPPFEFAGVLRELPVRKIFVRDVENYSFHGGLSGLSSNIDETVIVLRKLIVKSGARKVVSIGNCQGGYAALLFGALCGVSEILVFAPLSFLDSWNRFWYREHRWRKGFRRIYACPNKSAAYFDLQKVSNLGRPHIDIYYDKEFRLDRIHAERLGRVYSNISFFPKAGGQHLLVRNLKRSGELEEILAAKATFDL